MAQTQTQTRRQYQQPPAQTSNTAIQRVKPEVLARVQGTYRDAAAANARMEWALQNANLIAPAASIGAMPEGTAVALSVVLVDPEQDAYDVGMGKLGLSKSVLQKLGAALGVSWDPRASGRVDDRSDPLYCAWRAVGYYRAFDGQISMLVAEKELDLRDGSPTIEALRAKARAKGKRADVQIAEMRQHLQSHCETKAQLRAIRSLGIKTSYTRAELAKPFVAARVMFTGQSQDPELRKRFALMLAESFLSPHQLHAGPPVPTAAPRLHAPPPLTSAPAADDGDDFDADDFDAGEQQADPTPAQTASAPQPRQQPEPEPEPRPQTWIDGAGEASCSTPA